MGRVAAGINAKRPLGKDEEDFKSVPTKCALLGSTLQLLFAWR